MPDFKISMIGFSEANNVELVGMFFIIFGVCMILYIALFVDSSKDSSPAQASSEREEEVDEHIVDSPVAMNLSPKKKTPVKTPPKSAKKATRKKQEELGFMASPEGRRSMRLRNKTPAH